MISMAVVSFMVILSSMFIPTFVIAKLGLKWTLVAGELCYSTYIAAQFHPTFYTMIPAAVLVGLAAAPLVSQTVSLSWTITITEPFSL